MDIYTILASKPHNSYFLNHYYRFILSCNQANSLKTKEELGYTEKHHICPKAKDLFPEYTSLTKNPWNKAILMAEQHFIAHKLLWKAYGGSQSQAFNRMRTSKQNDGIITEKEYAKLREELAIFLSNRVYSEDTRKRMSESAKRKPLVSEETRKKHSDFFKSVSRTEEWKRNISLSHKGKVITEEQRKKISETLKGKSYSTKESISKIVDALSDKNFYIFEHKTGEIFIGTRAMLKEKVKKPIGTLFGEKARTFCQGWKIIQTAERIELLDT